jgi:hypothetical protein
MAKQTTKQNGHRLDVRTAVRELLERELKGDV